jgi:hypothetical protein
LPNSTKFFFFLQAKVRQLPVRKGKPNSFNNLEQAEEEISYGSINKHENEYSMEKEVEILFRKG